MEKWTAEKWTAMKNWDWPWTLGKIKNKFFLTVLDKLSDAFYRLMICVFILEIYVKFFGKPVFPESEAVSNSPLPIFL